MTPVLLPVSRPQLFDQPAAAGGRRNLLVCDDEESARVSLGILFKEEYNVLLATDGAEAVALAQNHSIDAAILDIRMAGMSGIEALQRLKQIDPSIEVIMLTGFETVETARQALRFGACEVLGQWVGPLAQNLDFWHANSRKFSLDNTDGALPITMRPSDYIRRNVRVSLFDIEPVDVYIDQFAMPEIYCYSSDYPHPEGGKDPMGDISAKLARLGPDVVRGVFVDNAAWLLPD